MFDIINLHHVGNVVSYNYLSVEQAASLAISYNFLNGWSTPSILRASVLDLVQVKHQVLILVRNRILQFTEVYFAQR